MELGVKTIVGGIALFVLGGLSVYLMTNNPAPPNAEMAIKSDSVPVTASAAEPVASASTDAESFYAAAEARREQQLADKAEADRLAKLKAIKERSVECKFWKQQQKTSSAAAKIDEKINEHCNLPGSSATSESSATNSSVASSSTVAPLQE